MSPANFCFITQTTEGANIRFPSPATDYVERCLCLNELFIHHPLATSLLEHEEQSYLVDAAITPVSGDYIAYELFGEVKVGRIMVRAIITPDGEALEGEVLNQTTILGCITLTITTLYDFTGPVI
ncbi:hypothetical protein SD961_16560 [Erwinia sp. MMLR14_017]|uniref:hypothetical protein n=1 Tax=Erwinia sp. MMLR14_017 TaxID=3093842 RepID=UPI002990464D|nr:hypothetical protein [Erwinia sp. MMLR14_017]MDW8847481.1 hypothetical protein [Erwinia sp. MMLR14_017]